MPPAQDLLCLTELGLGRREQERRFSSQHPAVFTVRVLKAISNFVIKLCGDAQKLSDKELAEHLFPKKALAKIKEELAKPPKTKRKTN